MEKLKTPEHIDLFKEILSKIKEKQPEKICVKPMVLFEDDLVKHVTGYELSFRKKENNVIFHEIHFVLKNIASEKEVRYERALKNTVTASERAQKLKDAFKNVSSNIIIEMGGSKNIDQMLEEAKRRKIEPYPTIKTQLQLKPTF
ncbi:hypothetical protein KJ980_04630 [Patescibacteria group bacterium]|nr:hypothetical protein [Patescibacteria group bacterium]MBU4098909.1 hypothetical protein [Patescibacteria group bacterium]